MGRKVLKVSAAVLAFALVILILLVTNAFTGNPISRALAQRAVERHVEQQYAGLDLEVVRKAQYSFKFGEYTAYVQSRTSPDTGFSIYCGSGGNILRDDYDSYVRSGWNTMQRISSEYASAVETLIHSQLDWEQDMVIAQLNEDGSYPLSSLQLDMNYDIFSGEIPGSVTVYLYARELTWKSVAEAAVELDRLLEKNQLAAQEYTVVLKPLTAKEEQKGECLGVYNFPRELLQSDNLPKVMEEQYRRWEEESAREKELEMQRGAS